MPVFALLIYRRILDPDRIHWTSTNANVQLQELVKPGSGSDCIATRRPSAASAGVSWAPIGRDRLWVPLIGGRRRDPTMPFAGRRAQCPRAALRGIFFGRAHHRAPVTSASAPTRSSSCTKSARKSAVRQGSADPQRHVRDPPIPASRLMAL